jgi:hypothetical protein
MEMESTEEMDYPMELLKNMATSDGVHNGVTYMLLLSLCHPRVEPTEEMRCL